MTAGELDRRRADICVGLVLPFLVMVAAFGVSMFDRESGFLVVFEDPNESVFAVPILYASPLFLAARTIVARVRRAAPSRPAFYATLVLIASNLGLVAFTLTEDRHFVDGAFSNGAAFACVVAVGLWISSLLRRAHPWDRWIALLGSGGLVLVGVGLLLAGHDLPRLFDSIVPDVRYESWDTTLWLIAGGMAVPLVLWSVLTTRERS